MTNAEDPGQNVIKNSIVKLYYHHDRLGSAEFLTDNISGKVTSYVSYDDWGAPTMKAVLKMGVRELDLVTEYTGHSYDPLMDVYYARARMYDAADRRFMATDPVKGFITAPLSLAQYTYCLDNPIKYTDPTGRLVSAWDTTNIPANTPEGSTDLAMLDANTKAWEDAKAAGNKDAMKEAHAASEAIRDKYRTGTEQGTANGDGNTIGIPASKVQEVYDEFWSFVNELIPPSEWQVWEEIYKVVINNASLNPDGTVCYDAFDWIALLDRNWPAVIKPDYAQSKYLANLIAGYASETINQNSKVMPAQAAYGPYYWNRWGVPGVEYERNAVSAWGIGVIYYDVEWGGSSQTISSFNDLETAVRTGGPRYAFYTNVPHPDSRDDASHYLVVTGTASAPGHPDLVATNNPWGDQNVQTFNDFLAGIPNDMSGMQFSNLIA